MKSSSKSEKTYARNKARVLGKKKPCEVCGALGEAHHEDYGSPLGVTWLCQTHHRKRHQELYQKRRNERAREKYWKDPETSRKYYREWKRRKRAKIREGGS